MLRTDQLSVSYGGVPALRSAAMEVTSNEIVAIIGANGAGKTTLLKAISGTVAATEGEVWFNDKPISALPAFQRSRLGITHVPQGRRIFSSLTVLENLELGAYRVRRDGERHDVLDSVFELFPLLAERRSARGGHLSGGQQQMLAIGRGLMAQPKILMLDEPSLGLAPRIVDEVLERIVEIHRRTDLPIILVEQRAAEALEIATRGYVLEQGAVTLHGPTSSLLASEDVQAAYLGV